MSKLLEVKNLRTYFYTPEGLSKSVDGVNFDIEKGETLGIVGESGCGKSVSCLSIMRLVQSPPGKIVDGEVIFDGINLLKLQEKEMRKIRGNRISMIFQEPMTSLNPVYTCGSQIIEAIRLHQGVDRKVAKNRAIEMLKLVGIPAPEQRINSYPHQLSGGMRQRVMIAMALSCQPDLLIADEPTTALDVTIQAQILELLKKLQQEFKMALILITHDLGIIAGMADRVAVMYASKVVEYTDVKTIFKKPKHPYTVGLLNSIPKLNTKVKRLNTIEGTVPNPTEFPAGCKFHTRCKYAIDKCFTDEPELVEIEAGHRVSCWRSGEING
jgi:peptide/nickel transport system ATP-binding protein/oligopeptide transport system ATP-binding protein